MKQVFFALSLLLSGAANGQVTTATDFTANDCSGVSHHLFAELDAGKVIVVAFVMPCEGCISPSFDAQGTVESFTATYPGRVEMFLADDEADNTCEVLNNWRNGQHLHLMPTFSDPSFVQSQYGSPAMPKIVVLGGTDHKVYAIQNNFVDLGALQSSINAALLGLPTGIAQAKKQDIPFSIFPDPSSGRITISCERAAAGKLNIQVMDMKGSIIRIFDAKTISGTNKIPVDMTGIAAGIYTVRIKDGTGSATQKVTIR